MAATHPPYLEAPALKRFSMHMRHGFFGRRGGVSTGTYSSLNCGLGSADTTDAILENRRRVARAVGGVASQLVTLRQVHSARCVVVDAPFALGDTPEADAMASRTPNIILGVIAADCAPVLLCDPQAGVIGAAHAGWRGAVGGVVEACIATMIELGADPGKTTAAVGPCLNQSSFEVGPELVETVLTATPWAESLVSPGRDDRSHFDLKEYILRRMARAGIAHAEALAEDTLSATGEYFSYRAARAAGEPDAGRNLSVITLLA